MSMSTYMLIILVIGPMLLALADLFGLLPRRQRRRGPEANDNHPRVRFALPFRQRR
ncbi:hypothetical protein [Sphingomicrobium arenosum]|uniref:hypothetical protein n=1 Tax=Sphingomicrobium arenosum TaxID=2233861 RepID=UPI002240F230|nr:hypothetical protein [Sphingomicrobium arenosum]